MKELFEQYENEIEEYCQNNGIDFSKVKNSPRCWGKDMLFFQYHDPKKGKSGLLDETPAPVTLKMTVNDGKLTFEQTEHTKKYLL